MNEKKHKWAMLGLSLAIVVVWFIGGSVGGPYFGKISEVSEVDLASFLPKSSESAAVNALTKNFRSEESIPAVVVFDSNSGPLSEDSKQEITSVATSLTDAKGVGGTVSPPIFSVDKEAALIAVPVTTSENLGESVDSIRNALDESPVEGTTSYVGGPAGFSADLTKAFAGIDGVLLLVALVAVFVILVIVYRSPILPILVLMTSVFALATSIILVYELALADILTINGQVQGILFILVIGAATDYSLLYVSRFREELYHHQDKLIATKNAWKASVEPILASGGTVAVGLMCLLLSDLASNKALGPVGAIGVGFSLLAALTLLPALLYLFGRVAFWPMVPKANKKSEKEHEYQLAHGVWHRVGDLVSKHPRKIWLVTTGVLLAGSLGLLQLKADGIAQSDLVLGESAARDAQEVLAEHFPEGSGSPATVIVSADTYLDVATKLEANSAVDSVSAVAVNSPSGSLPLGAQAESIKSGIREKVVAESGPSVPVAAIDTIVEQAYPFKDAEPKIVDNQIMLQATLTAKPDSNEAKAAIPLLREEAKSVDSSALIGGPTAVQFDTNEASKRDRMVILPAILVAITIILMFLLRSIVAPLLLLGTTVLSFAFSLGISALVFNHIFQLPGADPSVVLYGFVFLVALGIDYNIFLMTRVREESLKLGTDKGVIKGLIVTGGVITSAGIVLAATFAALAVIPIVFLLQLAFLVAFGVMIDTILVRSLLVPALVKDTQKFVWWPSKLK